MKKIPKCQVKGCSKNAQDTGAYRKDGSIRYRKSKGIWICSKHHLARIAKKHGVASYNAIKIKNSQRALDAGYDNVLDYNEAVYLSKMKDAGFDNKEEYKKWVVIQNHPYKKYRKDYCENIDGRLGFKCSTTIVWDGQLDCDHINGNPSDNREENIQTLCKCCHAYKGWINGDSSTPGRKSLGIAA